MRKLKSWIGGFLELTSELRTTPEFRLWSAISAVAAGLERRVFTEIMGRPAYPNMYIVLIGKPGSGKTTAIMEARGIVRRFNPIILTPPRITNSAFITLLSKEGLTRRPLTVSGAPYFHHSVTGMIDEMSVFLREGDREFQDDLADLFDNPEVWENRTQIRQREPVTNAWFNLICGTTPSKFPKIVTPESFDQGFASRLILVYSDNTLDAPLWGGKNQAESDDKRTRREALQSDLVHDFEQIGQAQGEFIWSKEARAFFEDWYSRGLTPYPMDSRLEDYCSRRVLHVAKLAMIVCASERDEMIITLDDIKAAKKILLDVESRMHKAIEDIGSNPILQATQKTVKFISRQYELRRTPVPEYEIRQILIKEVPTHLVAQVLDGIANAKMVSSIGDPPNRKFAPWTTTQKQ
jgi:hypothetical protein